MKVSEYSELIELDKQKEKEKSCLTFEDYDVKLNELITILAPELNIQLTKDKRNILRAKLNTLPPFTFTIEQTQKLNAILQYELSQKKIVDYQLLDYLKIKNRTKISVWKGDITYLKIDAIVNAANSQLEGCYQPLHSCIDNAIHSAAGVQLRDDCSKIIKLQGHLEKMGQAKITKAYNLPSKFVIHTVGPIVNNVLSENHKKDLYNSYANCLNICTEQGGINSIAFCGISTGLFGFPKKEASDIAFQAVMDWLNENNDVLERIVFNVYDDESQKLYNEKLKDE